MQPSDCQGCLHAVVQQIEVIANDVQNGIVDVNIIINDVGNKVKSLFEKIKNWFKHHL